MHPGLLARERRRGTVEDEHSGVISCTAYTHCPFLHKVGRRETLRSSDQIGSTERVRSIGSTATAQIHGRPRNIPWPQSPATRPPLSRTAKIPYVRVRCIYVRAFSVRAEMQTVSRAEVSSRRELRFCIISSPLRELSFYPGKKGRGGREGSGRRGVPCEI